MATVRKRSLLPGERIRVLIVDDSVVIRRLVTHAIESDPLLEVVGAASNGALGLQRIAQLNPDVVTLDVEMPEMNGLEALRHIHREHPGVRVIMFSTLTERGAAVTMEALTLGADDYVAKVSNDGSLDRSLERLRGELIPKIKQFFLLAAQARPSPPAMQPSLNGTVALPKLPPGIARSKLPPRVLAIGISTGGPGALGKFLPELPSAFPLPVLVVQHMPPMFTRLLAEQLNKSCQLAVEEARQGQRVQPGKILIAPGDFHLKVAANHGSTCVVLDQSPALNSCRPAADALFASVGEVYGGAAIALIMTGMGHDGLRGAEILKAHGAAILAQDEATSVVWGMPGSVVKAGIADKVIPLQHLVPEILRMVGTK